MGCVYFFKHNDSDYVKIGFTKSDNPSQRFAALSTYAPNGCEVLDYFNCDNPKKIEKEIHAKYEHLRVNGEWFNITDFEVSCIVKNYVRKIHPHVVKNKGRVIFEGENMQSCEAFIKEKYPDVKWKWHPFLEDGYYTDGVNELIINLK